MLRISPSKKHTTKNKSYLYNSLMHQKLLLNTPIKNLNNFCYSYSFTDDFSMKHKIQFCEHRHMIELHVLEHNVVLLDSRHALCFQMSSIDHSNGSLIDNSCRCLHTHPLVYKEKLSEARGFKDWSNWKMFWTECNSLKQQWIKSSSVLHWKCCNGDKWCVLLYYETKNVNTYIPHQTVKCLKI